MKYKVGDKARVIDNINEHRFDINTIVTIIDRTTYDYLAKDEDGDECYVTDEELQDVWDNFDETDLSYTYSAEARDLVEMFMNAHSGKMRDNSRIEWPTAVNITRIHIEGILQALERDDTAWDSKRLNNILEELNK